MQAAWLSSSSSQSLERWVLQKIQGRPKRCGVLSHWWHRQLVEDDESSCAQFVDDNQRKQNQQKDLEVHKKLSMALGESDWSSQRHGQSATKLVNTQTKEKKAKKGQAKWHETKPCFFHAEIMFSLRWNDDFYQSTRTVIGTPGYLCPIGLITKASLLGGVGFAVAMNWGQTGCSFHDLSCRTGFGAPLLDIINHVISCRTVTTPPSGSNPAASIPLGFICDHGFACPHKHVYKMIFTVSVLKAMQCHVM